MADDSKALEWKQAGNKALQEKDFQKAIDCFTQGLVHAPNNAILFSNRSAAFASQGDWVRALEDGEAAVRADPGWGKAYARKVLALLQLQRYEDAIGACQAGLAVDPSNQSLKDHLKEGENARLAAERNVLAEEFLSKNKFSAALDLLDTVVQLHPTLALYWSNRSLASRGCAKYAQAKNDANQVIWLKPDWHKGYQRMGEVLYAERNYEEACTWFARALQIKPGDATIMRAFSQAQQESMLEKSRRANILKEMEGKDSDKAKDKDKEKEKANDPPPKEEEKKKFFGFL